jgi:hypothetical protein
MSPSFDLDYFTSMYGDNGIGPHLDTGTSGHRTAETHPAPSDGT